MPDKKRVRSDLTSDKTISIPPLFEFVRYIDKNNFCSIYKFVWYDNFQFLIKEHLHEHLQPSIL